VFAQLNDQMSKIKAPHGEALQPENMKKNRYTNVLPYDYSRVRLDVADGGGDFINANFVDGYGAKKEYICCQGPLSRNGVDTVVDFWRMVWQQNVAAIVMTTRLFENGRKKCAGYWPAVNASVQHGQYYIRCLSEQADEATEVVERRFRLECDGAPERILTQYHFVGWPDFGVPPTGEGVFNILKKLDEFRGKGAPVVVHCSAGIGRTGTFCTIDIGMQMLAKEGCVDVPSIIHNLRSQRRGMVQSVEQLEFCFDALAESSKETVC